MNFYFCVEVKISLIEAEKKVKKRNVDIRVDVVKNNLQIKTSCLKIFFEKDRKCLRRVWNGIVEKTKKKKTCISLNPPQSERNHLTKIILWKTQKENLKNVFQLRSSFNFSFSLIHTQTHTHVHRVRTFMQSRKSISQSGYIPKKFMNPIQQFFS